MRISARSGITSTRATRSLTIRACSPGNSSSQILAAYPDLELEDIYEALRFAAEAV